MLPLSRYGPRSGYGLVVGGGPRARQSIRVTPQTSTGFLVCGCMVGGGVSLATLAPGTWCPQGLVVLQGVGSVGRHGVLSSTPHTIGWISAEAIHVVKSDLMQVPRILYPHHLKKSEVRPEDRIAARTQQSTLSGLPPLLHVAESQPLPEMTEKVDQVKGHQKVCHLLAPRVLQASNVCIQVSNSNGILPREYFQ